MASLGKLDNSGRSTPRLKTPRRLILGFLLRLCVIYILLNGSWTGLQKAHAFAYRYNANVLLTILSLEQHVWLEPCTASDPRVDMCVLYRASGSDSPQVRPHLGGLQDYRALSFMIALILATPIRWPRRLAATIAGLTLFSVFLAARLAAHFESTFVTNPIPWLSLSGDAKSFILFVIAHPPWYVAPVFIWTVVVAWPLWGELRLAFSRAALEP